MVDGAQQGVWARWRYTRTGRKFARARLASWQITEVVGQWWTPGGRSTL